MSKKLMKLEKWDLGGILVLSPLLAEEDNALIELDLIPSVSSVER